MADIALRVPNATAAFTEAVRRGARPVAAPTRDGDVVTATIMGFGDVVHTFVERAPWLDQRSLPGLAPVVASTADGLPQPGLSTIDHFAVCVEPGQIDRTVEFYRHTLDLELTFAERISVGTQAITTKVVQSRTGTLTLTLVEPDPTGDAGHVDEFLKQHGGPGVQHIAFSADSIVTAVRAAAARGVDFLATPAAYYERLPDRVTLASYSVAELRGLNVLVDADHDGQLFQIFTRSAHPRNTLFFELIERLGARSFGSGNITALYQAVESTRDRQPTGS